MSARAEARSAAAEETLFLRLSNASRNINERAPTRPSPRTAVASDPSPRYTDPPTPAACGRAVGAVGYDASSLKSSGSKDFRNERSGGAAQDAVRDLEAAPDPPGTDRGG